MCCSQPFWRAPIAGAALCDLPRIRSETGTETTIILNGVTVLKEFSLCAFRADEVELVEFGKDVCADPTQSIAQLVGVTCSGRNRAAPRSLAGGGGRIATQGQLGGYVISWEKR
ncbi:MAG: hypothetical protein ACRENB_12645 [Gemmatimonadales bacterium]